MCEEIKLSDIRVQKSQKLQNDTLAASFLQLSTAEKSEL